MLELLQDRTYHKRMSRKENERSQWRIKQKIAMTCIEKPDPPEQNLKEKSETQTEEESWTLQDVNRPVTQE